MKKIFTVALFITILAAVALSGCTILPGGQTSPTPTVIYGPVTSPPPTPTPTPVPGSGIANSKPSNDVKILTAAEDWRVVTDQKTRDGKQFENITLMVVNDGTGPAQNVMLAVTIIDETNLKTLIYQEFDIGDLSRGERKMVSLITDPHGTSHFIKVSISTHWGYNSEYYGKVPYENTFSFML
jgi:hypothetical protein